MLIVNVIGGAVPTNPLLKVCGGRYICSVVVCSTSAATIFTRFGRVLGVVCTMVWPFSNSSSDVASSSSENSSAELQSTSSTNSLLEGDSTNNSVDYQNPIFALEQIKRAGIPIEAQISPYLEVDPAIFRESTPQYLLPASESKGELEFAMGRIGWAVLGGYALGSLRGLLPELRNPDTRQLPFKPFITRLMNASVKHGSGYAHPAGSIVFMFSVCEMILGKFRGRDELNSVGAGAITGAVFRSTHGARASVIGAAVGLAVAVAWLLGDQDHRRNIMEMKSYVYKRANYDL